MKDEKFWVVPRIHQDKINKIYYLFRNDGTEICVTVLVGGYRPSITSETHKLRENEKKYLLEFSQQKHLK